MVLDVLPRLSEARRDDLVLREAGAVLLVACYELGHQPLSLASPVAALQAAGFAPRPVDTSVETLDDGTIMAARFVGIAVPMHTALRLGARLGERIKAVNPTAHVCFYGLYATLNAAYLLARSGDSVMSGEIEQPLVALVEALDRGEAAETVSGVGTRSRPAPPVVERIPLSVPDRSALPAVRDYAGLAQDGVIVPAGYLEATRGCHHTCLHCPITPIYGGRFTVIPREIVLADARAQIAAGARHLTFGDPDFFNAPSHGLRICRALREDFPDLTFDVTIKVEHLLQHRRFVAELAEVGCVFIVTAVESISDLVLEKLAKGHSRGDVEAALEILDDAGLVMRPSLLPFTPWETLDGYRALLRFIVEQDLVAQVDAVMLGIRLLVPPGSALLDDPSNQEWLGDLDAEAFTYRWTHPDPRMDALQREVSSIAEQGEAKQETAEAIFTRVWRASFVVGEDSVPALPAPKFNRSPSPRLTEHWFC
ncbi:MAG TPA: CUAEP/CCAEP-tail radical SAM protein [Thermomicrobiales bacterium]|nr:CUAEP/CCAEP-tail radical SAM protein [Thermomicrobiales bacterium]